MSEESNFQLLRECLATPLIELSTEQPVRKAQKKKGRKTAIKAVSPAEDTKTTDAAELGDFVDYLATELFSSLPAALRKLTYSSYLNSQDLQAQYPDPLPIPTSDSLLNNLSPSISDTLSTYSLLPPTRTPHEFLRPILASYHSALLATPPLPSLTRHAATACEVCDRSWIPLTYHHLIPKKAHPKALKRGWHTQDQLNNVAWLCRACHSFVHKVAGHDELAQDFFTLERLLDRDDVRKFAGWVGGVRWKAE